MSLSSIIFNQSIIHYREKWLKENNGYVKILSITELNKLVITKDNSSLVNPYSGTILGDGLKSCITSETMEKLKLVDPINKIPLQVVLVGCELYINPLFHFKCKEVYLAHDVVLIGRFGEKKKKIISDIVGLFNKRVIKTPHYDSVVINNSFINSKRALECLEYNNKVYSFDSYINIWEITSLGMYL